LQTLFDNGAIVLIILLMVVIEAAALIVFHQKTGRGIPALPLLANLIAGGCLMLAIRAALLDHSWTWIGFFMALSLIAHLVDFGTRVGRIRR